MKVKSIISRCDSRLNLTQPKLDEIAKALEGFHLGTRGWLKDGIKDDVHWPRKKISLKKIGKEVHDAHCHSITFPLYHYEHRVDIKDTVPLKVLGEGWANSVDWILLTTDRVSGLRFSGFSGPCDSGSNSTSLVFTNIGAFGDYRTWMYYSRTKLELGKEDPHILIGIECEIIGQPRRSEIAQMSELSDKLLVSQEGRMSRRKTNIVYFDGDPFWANRALRSGHYQPRTVIFKTFKEDFNAETANKIENWYQQVLVFVLESEVTERYFDANPDELKWDREIFDHFDLHERIRQSKASRDTRYAPTVEMTITVPAGNPKPDFAKRSETYKKIYSVEACRITSDSISYTPEKKKEK